MASGLILDYLKYGLAADRPATPDVYTGAVALYLAIDTATLSAWDGTAWVDITSGGGLAAWGSITGILSAQTDLQDALDLKAAISSLADVALSGDYGDLDNLPTLGTMAAADAADYTPTSGLGSAAFSDTGDFATAAQGALADSATQPGDSVTTLNMAADRLIGRSTAGAGAAEEIQIGANLTLVGGVLNAAGSGPGGADWGTIGGTLSDQLDLQAALDLKADTSSLANVATTGAAEDVSYDNAVSGLAATDVQAAIDELAAAPGGSTDWGDIGGTLSDQTDLQAALDAKASRRYTIVTEASAFTATVGTHDGLDTYTRAGGNATFNVAQAYVAGMTFPIRATGTVTLVGTGVTLNPPSGGTLGMTAGMAVQVVMASPTTADVIGQTVPA